MGGRAGEQAKVGTRSYCRYVGARIAAGWLLSSTTAHLPGLDGGCALLCRRRGKFLELVARGTHLSPGVSQGGCGGAISYRGPINADHARSLVARCRARCKRWWVTESAAGAGVDQTARASECRRTGVIMMLHRGGGRPGQERVAIAI